MSKKEEILIRASLEGSTAILMHNVRMASPIDPYSKDLKRLNKKKGKETDDYAEIQEVEFKGGLYHDPILGPYVPAEAIHRCIQEGGTQTKIGKKLKQALFVNEHAALKYEGPRDVEGLWKAGTFADVRMVVVGQSKVPRCRPIFQAGWQVDFEAVLLTGNELEPEHVQMALERAGKFIGLGDYRPRFGRFQVTRFEAA